MEQPLSKRQKNIHKETTGILTRSRSNSKNGPELEEKKITKEAKSTKAEPPKPFTRPVEEESKGEEPEAYVGEIIIMF